MFLVDILSRTKIYNTILQPRRDGQAVSLEVLAHGYSSLGTDVPRFGPARALKPSLALR